MSFRGEMNDFLRAAETGSRITLNAANRRRVMADVPVDPFGKDIQNQPGSFQPGQGGGVGTGHAPSGGVGTATAPNDFAKNAYSYYRQKGLSHYAAAGIVGNLMHESAGGAADVLNGKRMGDQGTAGYAGQWRGTRLKYLRDFAKSRGHDGPTVQDQLDFVLEEANGDSPYADPDTAQAWPQIMGATSVEQATKLFAESFERPADLSRDFGSRLKFASGLTDSGASKTQFAFNTPATSGAIAADDSQGDGGGDVASADAAPDQSDPQQQDSNVDPTIDAPAVDLTPAATDPQYVQTEQQGYAQGGAIPEDDDPRWKPGPTTPFGGIETYDWKDPNREPSYAGNMGTGPDRHDLELLHRATRRRARSKYAEGGQVQRFADGGQSMPSYMSAYAAVPAAKSFAPSNIRRATFQSADSTGGTAATGTGGSTGSSWRDWGTTGSPTQNKVRDARAASAAAAQPAATAAPVQDQSYAQSLLDWQKKAYPWGQGGGTNYGASQAAGAMPQPGANASAQDQLLAQQASSQYRNAMSAWSAKNNQTVGAYGGGANRGGYSSSRAQGGMVYSNFAEGGKVARRRRPEDDAESRLPDFNELNRRAQQQGQPSFAELQRRGTQGASSRSTNQDARDAAARRLNMSTRGVNSTAWRDPYLVPKQAPAAAPAAAPRQAAPRDPGPSVPHPTPKPPHESDAPLPRGFSKAGPAGTRPGGAYVKYHDTGFPLIDYNTFWWDKDKRPLADKQSDPAPEDPTIDAPDAATQKNLQSVRPDRRAPSERQFAEGGVIPDEEAPVRYARGGSARAESANLGPKRAKTDPWAGMRTKTSTTKKKTANKPQARQQRKQTKRKARPQQQLPSTAPIPSARPDPEAGVPTPSPRPRRPLLPNPATAPGLDNTPAPPRQPLVSTQPQPLPNPAASGSGPPPALDNGYSTIPGVRNAVPGTDVPRGGTWVDAYPGQPGAPRGAPPIQPAVQQPSRRPVIGGTPPLIDLDQMAAERQQRREQQPAAGAPNVARGAPQTQARPAAPSTAPPPLPQDDPRWARDDQPQPLDPNDPRWADDQGSLGYARGGVIPDDTAGPFRGGARGRGGLRAVFGGPAKTTSYAKSGRRRSR